MANNDYILNLRKEVLRKEVETRRKNDICIAEYEKSSLNNKISKAIENRAIAEFSAIHAQISLEQDKACINFFEKYHRFDNRNEQNEEQNRVAEQRRVVEEYNAFSSEQLNNLRDLQNRIRLHYGLSIGGVNSLIREIEERIDKNAPLDPQTIKKMENNLETNEDDVNDKNSNLQEIKDSIREYNAQKGYINDYLKGNTIQYKEELSNNNILEEFLMLNLRKYNGFLISDFNKHFGDIKSHKLYKTIKELEQEKMLKITKYRIYPTYEGMMLLDSILLRLFMEEE